MTVRDLIQKWRHDVQHAALVADERGAKLTHLHIMQLEAALEDERNELLTRAQAVEEFDVHPDTLTRHAREGTLRNSGRTHAPRYRRGDLAALGLKPRNPEPHDSSPVRSDDSSLLSFKRKVHARGRKGG